MKIFLLFTSIGFYMELSKQNFLIIKVSLVLVHFMFLIFPMNLILRLLSYSNYLFEFRSTFFGCEIYYRLFDNRCSHLHPLIIKFLIPLDY